MKLVRLLRKISQRSKPEYGIVSSIDGSHVNIRVYNSPTTIKHVLVRGDINSVRVGDELQLVWLRDGRPIALA